MAILYAMLRALVASMRLLASAAHSRARKHYERLESVFQQHETDCKAHEVDVGRPVDYASQLRLLKAFEAKEQSRKRWVRASTRLDRARQREEWVESLRGRKIPYTFGLIDMALVLNAIDRLGYGLTVEDLVAMVWTMN